MTCMLLSPWQPFSQPYGWSPMDPALPPQLPSDFGKHQYGYAASESESPQASNGSGKKRASRAGTRSVSTLSAAQLERKRANDRDAQRAIRQRTKDHIDSLEKTINELRMGQEAAEKLLAATKQQNREVMEENAYLRSKLSEAGIAVSVALHEYPNRFETAQFSLQSNSPVAKVPGSTNQPDDVASTPRSALSLATSRSSDSQQGSWQPSQSSVVQSAPADLQTASMMQAGSNVTNWRPHDGLQNSHSSYGQVRDASQNQSHIPYHGNIAHQSTPWETTPQPQPYQDQRLHPQHGPTPQQQQNLQYAPAAVRTYTAQSTSQQATYQPPAPPQAEFQGMTVASSAGYQVPEQQRAFAHRIQYAMSPPEISPVVPNSEFVPQALQIQPPQSLVQAYNPTQAGQQYSQAPQTMPFRDGSVSHSYPPTHYPSR